MDEQAINETSYEFMDDLPLSEHIEWSHFRAEIINFNKSGHDYSDWWLTT
jgi:hypothetical protein